MFHWKRRLVQMQVWRSFFFFFFNSYLRNLDSGQMSCWDIHIPYFVGVSYWSKLTCILIPRYLTWLALQAVHSVNGFVRVGHLLTALP